MSFSLRNIALFCLSACTAISPASAQPRIFFSDLESGPNAGGQNSNGAFVTIYGARFGAAQGTSFVSVGAGRAAAYPVWTDERITIQLGRSATTGNLTVTTPAGASNAIPFTVRPGAIYFVSLTGNDSASGSFSSPWRTLLKARDTIKPGDIVYAMNGVSQAADDGSGWSTAFLLRYGGTAGLPKALVAYPGAVVTIGGVNGPHIGVRTTDFTAGTGACSGYWVFAGLVLRGLSAMALAGGSNWRIVGNDISCPSGDGTGACFETSQASNVNFLGNLVHDTGKATASALYQGVYFSTDTNHVDAGWNRIERVKGCRGIQVHSSPLNSQGTTGFNQYDISIHDNLIHDTQCDGMVIATVDPSRGKVEVYNNIIYNAGQGPNNPEHSGGWSCILVPGTTNTGAPGGGIVDIFNNTLVNCGSFGNPPYSNARSAVSNGGGNQSLQVRLRNNIVAAASGAAYLVAFGPRGLCSGGSCTGIVGSNNLFFGAGAPPSFNNLTQSLNRDPLFVNSELHDFRLRPGSPAIGIGLDTGAPIDQEGSARGSRYDLGALQSSGQSSASAGSDPGKDRAIRR